GAAVRVWIRPEARRAGDAEVACRIEFGGNGTAIVTRRRRSGGATATERLGTHLLSRGSPVSVIPQSEESIRTCVAAQSAPNAVEFSAGTRFGAVFVTLLIISVGS